MKIKERVKKWRSQAVEVLRSRDSATHTRLDKFPETVVSLLDISTTRLLDFPPDSIKMLKSRERTK